MLKDVLSAAAQRCAFPPGPSRSILSPRTRLRLRGAGGHQRGKEVAITVTQTTWAPED